MIAKVSTEEYIRNQIGNQIGGDLYFFRLVDYKRVAQFEVEKSLGFGDFKERVGREFHVEVPCQRFWLFASVQNHTYGNLNRPLTPEEEEYTMGFLSNLFQKGDIRLFLEILPKLDPSIPRRPFKKRGEILLFFKLFEPETKQLLKLYAGMLHVKDDERPTDIVRRLNEMAGFAPRQEIELYREISGLLIRSQSLNEQPTYTFSSYNLVNGSIIWFQKRLSPQHSFLYSYPTIPTFFHYLNNRQVVELKSKSKDRVIETIMLSKEHTYTEVVCRVAKKLGLADPSKFWLAVPPNLDVANPRMKLSELLSNADKKKCNTLYYDQGRSNPYLWQNMRTLKVTFHSANEWKNVVICCITLPIESRVAELIREIMRKVDLPYSAADVWLFQVYCGEIYQLFETNDKVVRIRNEEYTLCAQELHESERELGPQVHFIRVYHYKKLTGENQAKIKYFGDPFLLAIKDDETLGQVKIRIRMKLQVSAEECSQLMFACIEYHQLQYLQDADILWNHFKSSYSLRRKFPHLGLEHSCSSEGIDPGRSSEMVDPPSSSRKIDPPSSSRKRP